MSEPLYFVRTRGKIRGPHVLENLRRMVRQGMLSRVDEISVDRVGWTPAGQYEELFPTPVAKTGAVTNEAPPAQPDNHAPPDAPEYSQTSTVQPPYVPPTPPDHPLSAAAAGVPGSGNSASNRTWTIVGGGLVGVAVVIIIVLGCLIMFRGKTEQTVPDKPMLTAEEIVKKSGSSVALIQMTHGSGSGFMVGPGMIATNHHVIRDAPMEKVQVIFPTSASKDPIVVSQILYESRQPDLAILAVNCKNPPLELAENDSFSSGARITVIGNPGVGNDIVPNAVTNGLLSSKLPIDGQQYYQLSIAINHGNSGGPVVDQNGKVIGVVTLKATEEEGLAFCVPVNDLRGALDKARTQTDQSTMKLRSEHNSKVVFAKLSRVGQVCYLAMYKQELTDLAKKAAPSDNNNLENHLNGVLGAANRTIELLTEDITETRFTVYSDQLLSEEIRKSIRELSDNCDKMEDFFNHPVDKPAGERNELWEHHKQLVKSLQQLLGIDQDDLDERYSGLWERFRQRIKEIDEE